MLSKYTLPINVGSACSMLCNLYPKMSFLIQNYLFIPLLFWILIAYRRYKTVLRHFSDREIPHSRP